MRLHAGLSENTLYGPHTALTSAQKMAISHFARERMPPSPPEALLAQALAHHSAGRLDAAEPVYQLLLRVIPNHPTALANLAMLYHQRHDLVRATSHYHQALSIARTPELLSNFALLDREQGDAETAVALLHEALALQPDFADAQYNLSVTLLEAGHPVEALAPLQARVAAPDAGADVHANLPFDEWAWRKGTKFGTIVVDLERRRVVDLLADRAVDRMADSFRHRPEIKIINRDRDGLYADAARHGAPQARQVADRFHLLKNLRETIARQLGGFEAPVRESATEIEAGQDMPEQPTVDRAERYSETAERERLRRHRRAARLAMFGKISALYDAGGTVREIAQKLGLGPRRVYRWVWRIAMPERSAMALKPCTPAYFGAFLARSWAEGTTKVRHLFSDITPSWLRGFIQPSSALRRSLA